METAKTGDVFLIPIAAKRFGVGQIVARYGDTELFYIAVFGGVVEKPPSQARMEDISFDEVILLANTFDVLIAEGQWPLIGNQAPPNALPFPSYKIGLPGNSIVESWDGFTRRRATSEEELLLDFRSGVAPIRLEKAVKAFHGFLPWHESFDEFTRAYVDRRTL